MVDMSVNAPYMRDGDQEMEEMPQLLKICKNQKCCGKYILYSEIVGGEKELVPLKKVRVTTWLLGSSATTKIELDFINASERLIECKYVFPLEKKTILSDFEAILDGKVIQTKIVDNLTAKE